MNLKSPIIGILGGMGPYATVDVFNHLLLQSHASNERELPHVLITSNPRMPSRTRSYLFGDASPVAALVMEANRLATAGASLIIVPCNSAHHFLADVRSQVAVPIVDMIEAVAEELAETMPTLQSVGLLGAEIVMQTDLYDRVLCKRGVSILRPDTVGQTAIRGAIDKVKNNTDIPSAIDSCITVCESLRERGAQVVVLACTELPTILRDVDIGLPIVDPNLALVRKALAIASRQTDSPA